MSGTIKIAVTDTTPEVIFDFKKGILSLTGKSIPEDPTTFFHPLIKLVEEYVANPSAENIVTIEMEYFNTPSAKYLMEILNKFEGIAGKGNKVTVNWRYEKADNDMLQAGKDYEAYLKKLAFKYIEIS